MLKYLFNILGQSPKKIYDIVKLEKQEKQNINFNYEELSHQSLVKSIKHIKNERKIIFLINDVLELIDIKYYRLNTLISHVIDKLNTLENEIKNKNSDLKFNYEERN